MRNLPVYTCGCSIGRPRSPAPNAQLTNPGFWLPDFRFRELRRAWHSIVWALVPVNNDCALMLLPFEQAASSGKGLSKRPTTDPGSLAVQLRLLWEEV
jgi:hypothetical protein